MKPILVLALVTLTTVSWLSVAAQRPQKQLLRGSSATILQGRIVLYDWLLHETTQTDDFVLKMSNTRNGAARFARIIYKPYLGWDAPRAEARDVLDRLAFVGQKGTGTSQCTSLKPKRSAPPVQTPF
jgi:hypothetical protein